MSPDQPVAGLVLAAGCGRRYGSTKALIRYRGQSLVRRSSNLAAQAGCDPVVVVVGAEADLVAKEVDFRVVLNRGWRTGMGSSLRAGLSALADTAVVAVVVLLVDMPGISVEAVRRVMSGAGADALVVAGYSACPRGHPVLLGRAHWAAVAESAVGDQGARDYLREHRGQVRVVRCDDVSDPTDIDVR
ncbi:nucleotidyltransferase family protein [Micromonospora sp. DPT]|uniref:nucleotidyltransferase family protein n=1 Tax=Micromonospora sp. DPT TaxID=3142975 RepID=UPI00320A0B49